MTRLAAILHRHRPLIVAGAVELLVILWLGGDAWRP